MPEIVLYYIWQHHLWASFPQATTDGRPIEVISTGQRNPDAGPDFTNVHLRIDGQDWFGNVEMHIQSGDWFRHRHHLDPAYDHIILHIVNHADKDITNSKGESIPQCELQYPKNQDYLTHIIRSATLSDSPLNPIACASWIRLRPALLTQGWRQALLHNRLECKRQSIHQLLSITHQDWNEAFYITLAHNFGFHTNGVPFETLALSTPLNYLNKHRDNLFQLTALLLGQSGLLRSDTATTMEEIALLNEYFFLQKKFSLTPMDASLWKMARIRPQNFPQTRIRQFAQLLHQSEFLFSVLMADTHISDMMAHLNTESETIEMDTQVLPPSPMGQDAIRTLLINTVFPYQYAYAMAQNDTASAQEVLTRYTLLPPENNTIIRQWKQLGQQIQNAADTQALIHLFQNFCQPHDCIRCEVGQIVFQQSPR